MESVGFMVISLKLIKAVVLCKYMFFVHFLPNVLIYDEIWIITFLDISGHFNATLRLKLNI